jgi:hypothetical protein
MRPPLPPEPRRKAPRRSRHEINTYVSWRTLAADRHSSVVLQVADTGAADHGDLRAPALVSVPVAGRPSMLVRICAVAEATATMAPSWSTSSPARKATSRPRRTTRPRPVRRPARAGRRNCTCRSVVGAKSPGSSPETRAGPIVSSSMAARNPPCTTPAGFRNASPAMNATSIVPSSGLIATSSQPRVTAAGGSGALPSTASQKGPLARHGQHLDRPICREWATGLVHRLRTGTRTQRARAADDAGLRRHVGGDPL